MDNESVQLFEASKKLKEVIDAFQSTESFEELSERDLEYAKLWEDAYTNFSLVLESIESKKIEAV